MFSASRTVLRSAVRPTSFAPARTVAGRRFLTTEPPHLRSRSWKSSAARWGIAIAGLYYYNTSPVFAEKPESNLLNPNVDALEDSSPTIETLTASSRRKSEKDASVLQSAIEVTSKDEAQQQQQRQQSEPTSNLDTNAQIAIDAPSDLEEEAAGEGAFNPVTGEINWDCPCLGGMAHGPCGPEFREAFSCFVYSTEEPKGMDCIDKFQNMQTCFRAHPEVYKGEIEDEEELDAELAQEREELAKEIAERRKSVADQVEGRLLEEQAGETVLKKSAKTAKTAKTAAEGQRVENVQPSSEPHPGMSAEHESRREGSSSSSPIMSSATHSVALSSAGEDELVPKAAHDARN